MTRKNNSLYKVKISGANSINFINNCIGLGLSLKNINRTSSKEMFFDINEKDYFKLSQVDNRGCQIELLQVGGKKKFFNKFIYRIGLVVGIIISIIGLIFINNRLLQIHIVGLSLVSKESVIESLNNLGVSRFSYMNYDLELIENKLMEEYDFSLVSIITKGNSIIISIKEELPSIEDTYAPITADYNMVIKSVDVFAGTSLIKSGDIVYKGDILVEPYIKSGESIVYVTPCANIVADVFFSNSYIFKNNQELMIRTGNKKIIEHSIYLGKFCINNNEKSIDYQTYEIENVSNYVSNYFLPINIEKTYAFETKKTIIDRDFEKEKDSIISEQKKLLYSSVPDSINIEDEEIIITPISDGYIINIHLMSTINLQYS